MTGSAAADPGILVDGTLKVIPAALNARRVVAWGFNIPGAWTLHWGDGQSTPGGAAAMRHTYAKAGAYTAVARDTASGAELASAQVFVRDGLGPSFELALGADNKQYVDLTITDDPADIRSDYEITWGVGGPVETHTAPKGTVLSRPFEPGEHTITVWDLFTGRAAEKKITVAALTYDPDFTIAKGADVNTALITITVAADPAKNMVVDWGDGKSEILAGAKVDDKHTHTYAAAGFYGVQLVYEDTSTDGKADNVTIPFPARDGKGIGRP